MIRVNLLTATIIGLEVHNQFANRPKTLGYTQKDTDKNNVEKEIGNRGE